MGRGYSSNSRMFEKRGDPWITDKEGVKDFHRNPETEDAEFDFDHRFHETGNTFGKPCQARQPEPYHDPKPKVRERTEADEAEGRKRQIMMRLNRSLGKRTIVVADPRPRGFRYCDGCTLAICRAANNGFGACKGKR